MSWLVPPPEMPTVASMRGTSRSASSARLVLTRVVAQSVVGLYPYSGKSPYICIAVVDLQPLENAATVRTLGRHLDQPDPHAWMRVLSEPEEERLRRQ